MATNYARQNARQLYNLAQKDITGDYVSLNGQKSIKAQWLDTGASVARAIAKELGMAVVRINKNKAGPAVSGEVYMDFKNTGKDLHLCFDGFHFIGEEPRFHIREGKNGMNRWVTYKRLAQDFEGTVEDIANIFGIGD
jgi:hypothetical protein